MPSQSSNNEMFMHLSYSGPLASWQLLFFPTCACGCVVLWNRCMCTEGCSLSGRHLATCMLLTHMPPTHGTPGLSIPGVLITGSQGIASLLALSCPFPHLNPLPLQPAWPPGSPHPDLRECSGEYLGPSQHGHCYILMCCVRSNRSFCSFMLM